MKSFRRLLFLSAAVGLVGAQLRTTTDDDGETIIISITTDVFGDRTTTTLSTIDPNNPTTATTALTTTPTTTRGRQTTTQRVVGEDTTAAPMRTTTYGYDPGNGVWVTDTWTASVTAAPSAATAVVPEGTIQNYQSYQAVINSAVLQSAQNALASASVSGAAARSIGKELVGSKGWLAIAVAVVGVVAGGVIL